MRQVGEPGAGGELARSGETILRRRVDAGVSVLTRRTVSATSSSTVEARDQETVEA